MPNCLGAWKALERQRKLAQIMANPRHSAPCYRGPSPAVTYQKNGLVQMDPTPEHLLSKTQHNASTNLLLLPAEIRNMIFQEVLGGFQISMNVPGLDIWQNGGDDYKPGELRKLAFVLPYVCRQIYTETAVLPYALNTFVVSCRSHRDAFAGNRNQAQLEAIQTIQVNNPFLFDSVNGTGFGGCSRYARGCSCPFEWKSYRSRSPPPLAMPFTLLFPNLRRIWIEVDVTETGSDVHFVKLLAQHAGFDDWKDYVTMRERGVLEVVEVVDPIEIDDQ